MPAVSTATCRARYGILSIHRSHRIEVPDPGRDGEAGRPHACTLCHVDRTLAWSAEQMNRIWGGGGERWRAPAFRRDGAAPELADAVASLLVGDPVQRAVCAAALGRDGTVHGTAAGGGDVARAHLLVTLHDAYPAVRWLARRSLLASPDPPPGLAEWDPLGGVDARGAAVRAWLARGHLPAAGDPLGAVDPATLLDDRGRIDLDAVRALLHKQVGHAISIGE